MKSSHDPSMSASVRPSGGQSLSVIGLFAFVVIAWSLNWVVMKLAVADVPPLWAVTIRTALAAAVLVPALLAVGQLALPPRGDYPIVLVIAFFHMVAFAALMTAGLIIAPAGRVIVLGYTTPLWVAPAAFVLLGERVTKRQTAGIGLGMVGLLLLAGPGAIDWGNGQAVLGNALPLLAALCWSVSIIAIRGHRWTATPFQLLPWQCLVATGVLATLAFFIEGPPPLRIGTPALLALFYNGVIGTALGYWAMTVVNRRVPAATAALGVLVTPALGIGLASVILGEGLDPTLLISATVIAAGVLIGRSPPAPSTPRSPRLDG